MFLGIDSVLDTYVFMVNYLYHCTFDSNLKKTDISHCYVSNFNINSPRYTQWFPKAPFEIALVHSPCRGNV